ncbi:MFS transporter [Sulfuriroseicoccus oceanibius]|uniref:MFS transporter n=1 Tax=Sulfuriroseicoccus oceanibius TaxID=2707525 RepID=A0A6B3LFY9_9BACT|nr:MFS transporter [Sulfuriroseicoccus oceanibius]QQL44796.1 MFS transporter [Sulfuriroseicoccus oceanibius]
MSKSKARTQHGLIFLTVLVDLIGFGIVIPLLPLYAEHFNAGFVELGILMALHSGMQFLFSPLLGRWSDKVGRRPVLMISIVGNVIAYSVLAGASSLWMLFLARFLSGVSSANISTAQAYMADITPREKRAGAMGMIGAAFGIGFVLGPLISATTSGFGIHVPFLVAVGLSLFNACWVAFKLPESLPPAKRKPGMGKLSILPHHRLAEVGDVDRGWLLRLLSVYFLNVTAFSGMTTLFVLFTNRRFGFEEAQNGWLFTLVGVIGVVIQGGMIRRIEPKVGAYKLALLGAIILAVTLTLMPWTSNWTLLILFTILVATGNSLVQPSLNTIASRIACDQSQGTVLGLMASSGSLGRVVGPVVCGWLLSSNVGPGFGSLALWCAGGVAVLAALALASLGGPAPHQR